MEKEKKSPKILSLKWGKMDIEQLGLGKDFRLWPGGGSSWDWQETGTQHSPGILPSDCEVLIKNSCRVIVLGRGMLSRLKVSSETVAALEQKGIKVIVASTKKAAKIYNTLVDENEAVGGLFHSTC